jgi:hypothetical protein
MECLRGTQHEVTPKVAMGMIFERFMKQIGSWASTTKTYILFHRCL